MVAATKPITTSHAERLLDLYRREEELRGAHALLEELIALPNVKNATRVRICTRLGSSRFGESAAKKMAESALREMLAHGHRADIEAFLETQTADRVECELRDKRAAKVAAILDTARRADATFHRSEADREIGDLGSTELLLMKAIETADLHDLPLMLRLVLSLASDDALNAVHALRDTEERMLAEYHAEQKRAAA